MLSAIEFICQSLELHLFFARIMKEHSFFLEIGFTRKNSNLIKEAGCFRRDFDILLAEVVSIANGVVSSEALKSGEVITPYTLPVEIASSYFTGIKIPTALTKAQAELTGCYCRQENQALIQKVHTLNQKALILITALIKFKEEVLAGVLGCKIFTVNYPLFIDHIIREAKLYLGLLEKIQTGKQSGPEKKVCEQELFWNTIMSDHAKFLKGLLDPSESKLIEAANDFSNEFDQLIAKAQETNPTMPPSQLTKYSFRLTKKFRYFKAQGTERLLECKFKSVIIPLLADHTLREANHYLRLLKMFRE